MAKPLALTSGEPAGIGPDIAIAAWLRRKELDLPPFYLLGERAFFAERAKILGLQAGLADVTPEEASAAFAKALPVVATGEIATARPGQPDDTSASAALASIRHAVEHVRRGRACAVVTNPIAKSVLYRAGFRHPGHTEFLAELAADCGRGSESAFRPGPAAACHIGPQSACRRRRLARQRRHRHRRAGHRNATRRRHRRQGPLAGGYHVPRRSAQELRLRDLHVSRPGADPDQDDC